MDCPWGTRGTVDCVEFGPEGCDGERCGSLLLADGWEDCFVGTVRQFTNEVACYDLDLMVDKMCRESGVSREEAIEYLEYNVLGAYVGPKTPAFLEKKTIEEVEQ